MKEYPEMNSMKDLEGINYLDRHHSKSCYDLYKFMGNFIPDLKNKNVLEIRYKKRNHLELPLEGNEKYSELDNGRSDGEASDIGFSRLLTKYEYCEPENLNEGKTYDVIVLNHIIEYTSDFEMESTWEKIKKTLSPGGYIILKNTVYDNLNPVDENHSLNNIEEARYHDQILGTILRICLKHGFIVAGHTDNCFGIVKKTELPFYNKSLQDIYLTSFEQLLSKHGVSKVYYEDEELEEAVPRPGRLLIGCVTENIKKYRDQTLRLVHSIRWFGGSISRADIFVCIVDDTEPKFVKELNKLGAFVRVVKRFSKDHPQSNKLRLFEIPEINFYDSVLLLDCDTLVVQDPSPYIDGKYFQAEIAAGPTVPHYVFKSLFSHFGLNLLPLDYKTIVTNTKTMMYCNAGVLLFPKKTLQTFYPIWKKYTLSLIDNKHLLGKYFNFCEQASLTLAYADYPIPFRKFPMEMNFHLFESKLSRIKDCDPVIIHYHNQIDEDGLIIDKTSSLSAKNRIKQFNERLIQFYKKEEQS
ncbi:hypothetical protein AF332_17055 [Sporosarcina globispora]|uniref:Uncharacterized protein n=1 Tax=Sporosarcina globispora TaxID=1459 RepID=A0A0M0GFT1_SPOGL|nr:hypothetical protein [Sporosarcina globispora]KON88342.1 hypothetical protein AF332_17055 [Sporosarcina globispora]